MSRIPSTAPHRARLGVFLDKALRGASSWARQVRAFFLFPASNLYIMNDDVFYNQVAEEIQANKTVPGLWTKAFAEANGKTDEARALYIKHRVLQLADEHTRVEREKREQLKRQSRIEQKAAFERVLYKFAFGCVLVIVIFGAALILAGIMTAFIK